VAFGTPLVQTHIALRERLEPLGDGLSEGVVNRVEPVLTNGPFNSFSVD
jgi:hypothetical protein